MSSEEGKNRTGVSHRPYDEAFKRAAVAQWASGVPASRVAGGLGITAESLRAWRQFAGVSKVAANDGPGKLPAVAADTEELRAEVRRLRAQLQSVTKPWSVMPSMSRRANCHDNAAMESFWSTLKEELVHRRSFVSRAEAAGAIFDYIETFYNRERLHSALGFMSLVEFEKHSNLN